MKNPADQANFFRDLAKLLWYLSSGTSHAGYLCNCPRNPFVEKLVWFPYEIGLDRQPRIMHDCIVVRRMEDHEPADSEYFEETMMDEDTDSDELDEEMNEVVF